MKKINLIGMKFGRLTVLEEVVERREGRIVDLCECECGKKRKVRRDDILSGKTKSCGCLRGTHRMYLTTTYKTWKSMIQRCTNKKTKEYPNYGGRGIIICEEWKTFSNFFKDMGERPEGKTIDRKNNNLGYFKENCAWSTRCEQSRNTRMHSSNKTGVRGCYWDKRRNRYLLEINANNIRYYLGVFKTIEEAKTARKQGELKFWGKNDNRN